jgi:N-acetylglucosamine kinase-like BadF-type ATPase
VNIEQYKSLVKEAIESNDENAINIISKALKEHEDAAQILRQKGYGWTGLNLVETAKLVKEY